MPFTTPHVDARITGDRATLLEPVCYKGRDDTWTIPRGFATDFASVPRWATAFVPKMGRHTLAAIVHDWLCHELRRWEAMAGTVPIEAIKFGEGTWHRRPTFTAVDADGIFRRIMREEGVSFPRRWLAWAGVRWGALYGPDRHWHRAGWWRTLPQLAAVTIIVLTTAAAVITAAHLAVDALIGAHQ